MPQEVVRFRILVKGEVQGVGYRWFVRQTAERLKVFGWVRNLAQGDVELEAEGGKPALEAFLKELKSGHPYARVESLETREVPTQGAREGFGIT